MLSSCQHYSALSGDKTLLTYCNARTSIFIANHFVYIPPDINLLSLGYTCDQDYNPIYPGSPQYVPGGKKMFTKPPRECKDSNIVKIKQTVFWECYKDHFCSGFPNVQETPFLMQCDQCYFEPKESYLFSLSSICLIL